MDTVRNRIKAVLEAVEQMIYSDRQPVISVKIAKADYHFEEEFHREGKDFRDFGRNETWGELDQHYFFLADVAIPEQMEGHTVRAVLNTGATDIWNTDNPQIMAYVNGRFAATLDMNHQFIILSEHAKAGENTNWLFMRIPVRMQARLPVRISSAWSWQSTGKRRRDSIMTCRLSMKLRIFCRRTIYPGSRALKHWKDA